MIFTLPSNCEFCNAKVGWARLNPCNSCFRQTCSNCNCENYCKECGILKKDSEEWRIWDSLCTCPICINIKKENEDEL